MFLTLNNIDGTMPNEHLLLQNTFEHRYANDKPTLSIPIYKIFLLFEEDKSDY